MTALTAKPRSRSRAGQRCRKRRRPAGEGQPPRPRGIGFGSGRLAVARHRQEAELGGHSDAGVKDAEADRADNGSGDQVKQERPANRKSGRFLSFGSRRNLPTSAEKVDRMVKIASSAFG